MPFSFTLTVDDRVRPAEPVATDLAGEDISIVNGQLAETPSGDLAVVSGVACGKQSVIREAVGTPGSFTRRPDWGAGLAGSIFKNATRAEQDRGVSRLRARMLANRRVTKIHEVSALSTEYGTQFNARCDVVGGRQEETIVIKPPGVS